MGSGPQWAAEEAKKERYKRECEKGNLIKEGIAKMHPHELFMILSTGEDTLNEIIWNQPLTKRTSNSLESLRLRLVRLFNGCPDSTTPPEYTKDGYGNPTESGDSEAT